MTAQLDKGNHYEPRLGSSKETGYTLSDPRLQRRLDLLPPHTPPTTEYRARVATWIARAYPVDPDGNPRENLQARLDLLNALFGDKAEELT